MSKADRFRKLAQDKQGEVASGAKTEVINAMLGTAPAEAEPLPDRLQKPVQKTEQVTEQKTKRAGRNTASKADRPKAEPQTNQGEDDVKELLKSFEKERVEDTHTRATYLIKNTTLKKLDRLAKGKGKGFKTQLVNYALERLVNELLSD